MLTAVRRRTGPLVTLAVALTVSAGLVVADQPAARADEPYKRLVAEKKRDPRIPGDDVHLRVADLNALFTLSTNKFVAQLRMLRDMDPQVILLQEVADRGRVLNTWAKRNGYRIWLPGGPRAHVKNHSVVLWKDSGRFQVLARELRLGSTALTRPGGGHVGVRYLSTVRMRDRRSNQRISFTSTHATPDAYVKADGRWRPRWGSEALTKFRRHMRRTRELVNANGSSLSVIGGDFNAAHRYEKDWYGFMSDRFGDLLRSNHQSLGRIGTMTTKNGWAFNYIYTNRKPRRIGYAAARVYDTYSDHHAVVVDFRVKQWKNPQPRVGR